MNLNQTIPNSQAALMQVRRILRKTYNTTYMIEQRLNNSRHFILKSEDIDLKYYLMWKSQHFMSFNTWFPLYIKNNPEYSGIAQSINKHYLNIAAFRECKIVIVTEDGYILSVFASFWKKYAEKYKLIRQQYKENIITLPDGRKTKKIIKEITYCLPLKLFEGDV